MWDPAVNAPTSVSGKFIGDYQGLVADDEVAIPFWNDTQLAALPATDKEHSPYQEVFAARVPERHRDAGRGEKRCFPRSLTVGARSIGKPHAALDARRSSAGARPARAHRARRAALLRQGRRQRRAAFDAKGRVSLAATTARRHRRQKIGRGSTLKALHAAVRPPPAQRRARRAARGQRLVQRRALRGAPRQGDVRGRRRPRARAQARRAHDAATPRRARSQALSRGRASDRARARARRGRACARRRAERSASAGGARRAGSRGG